MANLVSNTIRSCVPHWSKDGYETFTYITAQSYELFFQRGPGGIWSGFYTSQILCRLFPSITSNNVNTLCIWGIPGSRMVHKSDLYQPPSQTNTIPVCTSNQHTTNKINDVSCLVSKQHAGSCKCTHYSWIGQWCINQGRT